MQLVFASASSAKLDAVLLGRKFICTEFRDTTLLEGLATNDKCHLKDRLGKSDYVLPVSEFNSSNVKILAVKPSGVPLQVQFANPANNRDEPCLWVNDKGDFVVSDHIGGCTITVHCPIYYPEVVMMSEEAIDIVRLHLIGRDGGGLLLYAGVDSRLQPSKLSECENQKVVRLEFDEEAVRLEPLHGTQD